MGKKRVVLLKKVKKPCLKRDGAVARRSARCFSRTRVKKATMAQPTVATKPTRLNWVGSKKKKMETDKERRHRLPSLPTFEDFSEVDDLQPDFYVGSEVKGMKADFEQDRITGDDGLSGRYEGGRYEY